ncbi:MAG: tellurite resistance protein TerC [Pontimonas sp.]|jgi:tellurite resistance protein TerC
MRHWNEDPDPSENFLVRQVKEVTPLSEEHHGTKLFVEENGERLATPMFLVIIAIAFTDIPFALDSIPATFGVAQEPFLVFSANTFALLGLRALYFILKGLLDKPIYLSLGLSFVLIFIGIKLMLLWAHDIWEFLPKIETSISLWVIGAILGISVVTSFIKSRRDSNAVAHAGRVTGHNEHEERHSPT